METQTFNEKSSKFRKFHGKLNELMSNPAIRGAVKECAIKSYNATAAIVAISDAAYDAPDENRVIANQAEVDNTVHEAEVYLPNKKELMAQPLDGHALNDFVPWFCADWSE
jgi:hypothetical protein